MRIAIPLTEGLLSRHFGRCDQVAFFEVDEHGAILHREDLAPPRHQVGSLPRFVAANGATVVLGGGIGTRAIQQFELQGISVVVGCSGTDPSKLAQSYRAGILEADTNECDRHKRPQHGEDSCHNRG